MKALALLLLPPLALAHPGHDDEAASCGEGSCPPPARETSGRSQLHLAEVMLARGDAAEAARLLALPAERDGEAACLLAFALLALGDAEGAQAAASRADATGAAPCFLRRRAAPGAARGGGGS